MGFGFVGCVLVFGLDFVGLVVIVIWVYCFGFVGEVVLVFYWSLFV